jgi:hypothetical protein
MCRVFKAMHLDENIKEIKINKGFKIRDQEDEGKPAKETYKKRSLREKIIFKCVKSEDTKESVSRKRSDLLCDT